MNGKHSSNPTVFFAHKLVFGQSKYQSEYMSENKCFSVCSNFIASTDSAALKCYTKNIVGFRQ